jgi:hypothetical protein
MQDQKMNEFKKTINSQTSKPRNVGDARNGMPIERKDQPSRSMTQEEKEMQETGPGQFRGQFGDPKGGPKGIQRTPEPRQETNPTFARLNA